MHHYLKELNQRFDKDISQVNLNRSQWPEMQKLAAGLFREVAEEAKEENFYEFLYYKESDSKKDINQNFVMLYAGKKTMGITSVSEVYDEKNRKRTVMSGSVEDGGGLSIVQSPDGSVFFLVFPCSSKLASWEDNHLVYKHFKSPSDVTYSDIKKAVEFYLKFMLFTSYCSKPTLAEKAKISFIKFSFEKSWLPITKFFATSLLKLI